MVKRKDNKYKHKIERWLDGYKNVWIERKMGGWMDG